MLSSRVRLFARFLRSAPQEAVPGVPEHDECGDGEPGGDGPVRGVSREGRSRSGFGQRGRGHGVLVARRNKGRVEEKGKGRRERALQRQEDGRSSARGVARLELALMAGRSAA